MVVTSPATAPRSAGGGVDLELACPQPQAGEVDLDHGPVLHVQEYRRPLSI